MQQNLVPLVDEGLGNSSYLLDLGDGRALAVDPSRDLRAMAAAARRRGLRMAFAAETHLHADFVSGARQLAADHGAQILASASGARQFPHAGLHDGDEVDLGGLTLRALATTGHTPEHLSYLILDGSAPVGVFTGGSLIVGSAARTDLSGAEHTDALARAQYRSLQRLATLPDQTAVWPTHGAGSFCSAPVGAERTSTIGEQRRSNTLLALPDEDSFVAALLGSLGTYPSYFGVLAQINRRGPAILTEPPHLAPLRPDQVRTLLADSGAVLVDVRDKVSYASGHIAGSVAIPLRPQFAPWLGWLLAVDTPVIFVRDEAQRPEDIAWPALAIGFENLLGELAGGAAAWRDSFGELRRTALGRTDAAERQIVDVRQASEFAGGHAPGAHHLELGRLSLGQLAAAAGQLPAQPLLVMCGHGERATTAASLLERAGHSDVAIFDGGPREWSTTAGRGLARP